MQDIQHPAAYESATRRYIIANAYKTWMKNTPRWQEIVELLEKRGKYYIEGNGYYGIPQVKYNEGFFGSLAKSLDDYGKLSEKQIQAVLKCVEQQAERKIQFDAIRDAKKASSKHVGEIGQRMELVLTCEHVIEFDSQFGLMHICLMRDAEGNRVVYKGSKYLLDKGETQTFKATIKDHSERDGELQTLIARPVAI